MLSSCRAPTPEVGDAGSPLSSGVAGRSSISNDTGLRRLGVSGDPTGGDPTDGDPTGGALEP